MQNALTRHPEYADAIHTALSFPARDDETAARIVAAFLALQAA
jgi:hypothetical protein